MKPRRTHSRGWLVLLASILIGGCGEDYRPPSFETTGIPAVPLDQVFDLEVTLPGLQMRSSIWGGAQLEIVVEMEESGFGKIPARFVYGPARVDGREEPVQDLSGGRGTITVTPERWSSGTLGPLVVEGTPFELILDGSRSADGWTVSGASYETQTATQGIFRGWRRHRFLVAGTDFLSDVGVISEVALVKESEIRVRHQLEFVGGDPVVRLTRGSVFAVNRFTFDNLQRLDPTSEFRTAWQRGVGGGSNPHDVILHSAELGFVSRYEPPYNDVAVFDPVQGTILQSISLAELAENPDGTPRPDRMVEADGMLFVALQDIDRSFRHFAEGKLAVVDPVTLELRGAIPLGGTNPSEIEVVHGLDGRTRLYVALGGIFDGLQGRELSGGVVVVDVTNQAVERWALDDDVAGGNVGGLALAGESLGYVIVSLADGSAINRVLAFDPRNGTILRTVFESYDFIPELETDSSRLLAVPNRSLFQPGLCLYRPSAEPGLGEVPLGCAALQLPPFSIEALD